jgi:hypothetical protein
MTYGCAIGAVHATERKRGAAVSHSAELVRGHCGDGDGDEGPLIRPFGPPSPQGEKWRWRLVGG